MRTIRVFESISIDGYFKSASGDMSWAHRVANDPEFDAYVVGNASSGGALLFGRTTYEMMASFWPTPAAAQQMPEVAKGMNAAKKYVLSRTLRNASWANTTVLDDVEKLEDDVTILGSGSVVAQLSKAKRVSQYTLVVLPVALGSGTPLFTSPIDLRLVKTRSFPSGRIVLVYEPAK